jgi:hypothetical protein
MTAIKDTFHPPPPPLSVEEILRNIAEGQARRRAELGLPPLPAVAAPKEMTGQIVETVERLGPSRRPWGFVLLRVTYGDDARWEAFKSRFMELLQKSVDPELEVGWERIKDDLSIEIIEDVALDRVGLPESLQYVYIQCHVVISVRLLSIPDISKVYRNEEAYLQDWTYKCFSLLTRSVLVLCSRPREMESHLCLHRMLNMDNWKLKSRMTRNRIQDFSKSPSTLCLAVFMLACKAWGWLRKSCGPLLTQSLKAPISFRLMDD